MALTNLAFCFKSSKLSTFFSDFSMVKFCPLTWSRYCSKEKQYIVVGDSNKIKKIISSKFNNILNFHTEITHLGEDDNINNNALIETILDFNMMRFSNSIISFTAYGHGSGFSKYCATLYNIPFNQILLKPTI